MLKVIIKEEDRAIFAYERYNHPHARIMKKMDVMHLKSKGIDDSMICKIVGICPNTMRSYYQEYMDGGIEKLRAINFYRPQSQLEGYSSSIEEHLKNHPPASISQAVGIIEELTGIKRGDTQVRNFLKSHGFRFRKTGTIPANADTETKKKSCPGSWEKC